MVEPKGDQQQRQGVIHLVLHTGFDNLYHIGNEDLLETMRCKSTYNNCEKTANSGDHQKKSRHDITFGNKFMIGQIIKKPR